MVTASFNRRGAEMARGLRWVGLVALAFAWSTPASAQLGRQLESRGVSWTPSVALRDFGTDSNVYLEPGQGRSDRLMTLTPSAQAKTTTRHFILQGDALADFVYYERFVNERMINRKGNGRADIELGRFAPYVSGSFDRGRERQGDVDLRIGRLGHTLGGGLSTAISANGTLELGLNDSKTTFDGGQTFRGIDVAKALNRKSRSVNLGVRYRLTALTNLGLDASVVRDKYVTDPTKNSEDRRLFGTVIFAPDAVVKGRIVFGYHRLRAQLPQGVPYKGFLADANVGYTFKESSRFNLRYYRDTNVSFDSPFNVQVQYGVDLVQDLLGPLKGTAGVSRQNTRHALNTFLNQQARLERYDSYAVGLAFYWSTSLKSTLAYDVQRRRSSIAGEDFQRKRLLASFSIVL